MAKANRKTISKSKPKTPKPVRSVTELYAAFDKAHDAMRATSSDAGEGVFGRLADKCFSAAFKVVQAPARTIDEIMLKFRVAAWDAAVSEVPSPKYKHLSEFDHWQPADEEHMPIASLRDDVRTILDRGARPEASSP